MDGQKTTEEIRKLVEEGDIQSPNAIKLLFALGADLLDNQLELGEKLDVFSTEIRTNPMLRIGEFMKKHPKISITIGGVILTISQFWALPGVRRGIFTFIITLFGLPKEWIDLVSFE